MRPELAAYWEQFPNEEPTLHQELTDKGWYRTQPHWYEHKDYPEYNASSDVIVGRYNEEIEENRLGKITYFFKPTNLDDLAIIAEAALGLCL